MGIELQVRFVMILASFRTDAVNGSDRWDLVEHPVGFRDCRVSRFLLFPFELCDRGMYSISILLVVVCSQCKPYLARCIF
jgi:hypothetical protein